MSSKWNVIVAVKIYNKDIDKGKSYWQPWLENKSLSSEKKRSNHRNVNSYLQHLHEPLQSDSSRFEVISPVR